MAYSRTHTFYTGSTGLALEALIVDTTGATTVAAGGTGIVELGGGWYSVSRADIPDGHRGALIVRLSGAGAIQAVFAINPQENEYSDVKTSTRSSHSVADVWNALTSGFATAGSVGKLIADRWAEYTAARAAKLDNLDATVSSRAAAATVVAPDLCRVYGYEFSGGGRAIAGRTIVAELSDPPQTTGTVVLETERERTTSGSGGYWFLDLVREKTYRLIIPEAGIDQDIVIPDAAEVDVRTLL